MGAISLGKVLRFFWVTVIGLLVDFTLFYLLQLLGLMPWQANFTSTCFAVATTYLLSSKFVFLTTVGTRTLLTYFSWYAISNFIFSSMLQALSDQLWWSPLVLKVLLLPMSFGVNYLASNRILSKAPKNR